MRDRVSLETVSLSLPFGIGSMSWKDNSALAVIDSSKQKLDEMEKTLKQVSDRMVTGVGFKYGRNSNEYELAGGIRESERIRKSRLTRLKPNPDKTSVENAVTTLVPLRNI
ncbi:hypothetical protein [Nostoc sp. FACHB-110]|uniref:hypothetical protein n=1 Tax=Nostoc sp. FACHB-110 TaxID=2692834 RepID=UPI001F55236E|nr:hypothetical protein [Nostoc sp. FACHB-110]